MPWLFNFSCFSSYSPIRPCTFICVNKIGKKKRKYPSWNVFHREASCMVLRFMKTCTACRFRDRWLSAIQEVMQRISRSLNLDEIVPLFGDKHTTVSLPRLRYHCAKKLIPKYSLILGVLGWEPVCTSSSVFVFIENFIQHTFSSKKAIYRNSCRTLLLHWGF